MLILALLYLQHRNQSHCRLLKDRIPCKRMYEQLLVQSIARRTYGSMRVKRELWAAEITKGVAFLDFDFLVFLTFFSIVPFTLHGFLFRISNFPKQLVVRQGNIRMLRTNVILHVVPPYRWSRVHTPWAFQWCIRAG